MELRIDVESFFEMVKKTYSLDHVFLLRVIEEGIDLTSMCESSERFAALHTSLIRKGLISDIDNKITLIGQELLKFAESEGEGKIEKIKPDEDKFLLWWKTYPAIDSFQFKAYTFNGSRGLKVKKDECRTKFNKILIEGDYTADDLIRALKYEVDLKIKKSIETGQNKLSYMQNSLTYLNQRTYENFIEISKDVIKEETKFDGVNI